MAARFTGPQRPGPADVLGAQARRRAALQARAARNRRVERRPRRIEISRLALTLRDAERIDFAVECSKGTYVRVLAADVGRALGTVAHLERLRRTAGRGLPRRAGALARGFADVARWARRRPCIPVRDALAGYAAFPARARRPSAALRRGQQDPLARLASPAARAKRRSSSTTLATVAGVIESAGARPGVASGAPASLRTDSCFTSVETPC